ncbi:MAG: hypothetical protein GX445_01675 [Elusimicrobia bacterium]|jgi:diphthine-ammonia ligase|nr:hypothetical protein [Elusimicrobiota bacterium]
MKDELAFVLYSGGKDSHIALYNAIKDGYDVVLFHANSSDMSADIFSSPYVSDIVKKQASLMGIQLYELKIKGMIEEENIFLKIIKLLKSKHKKNIIYYDSFQYSASISETDIKNIRKISEIFKANGIRTIPFSKIIKGNTVYDSFKSYLKSGIKAIITGVENGISSDFLGKELDDVFIKHLKELIKKNNGIGGYNYQTLVTSSPLFNGYSFKITQSKIFYNPKNKSDMLKIIKWKCYKNNERQTE